VPAWFHVAAAAWIGVMLALSAWRPAGYVALQQEDRFVEWWTVTLFAAAGVIGLRSGLAERRVFDLLVALFCLFVAGEEFSWGQRLLGFTPPAAFLEHNIQQEFTLHNFADVFGQPKVVLMLALLGYGVVLPLAGVPRLGRRLLEALGATPPPASSLPWFLAAVGLLWWYPADFTGEWVEALAGGLFLITGRRPEPRAAGSPAALKRNAVWPASALAAVALSGLSGWSGLSGLGGWNGRASSERIACARVEAEAIAADLQNGAATSSLLARVLVHKRLMIAAADGYLDARRLTGFASAPCSGSPRPAGRTALIPGAWPTGSEPSGCPAAAGESRFIPPVPTADRTAPPAGQRAMTLPPPT